MISAYQIGVNIAMTNGVSQVLKLIQTDVLGLHKAVDATTGAFSRMKLAALGFAGVTIGGAMLGGLYELSKAAEKYTEQLVAMRVAGMNAAEQQQSIAAANRVSSQVLSTSPTQNLQAIRELRAALNSAGASPQAATEEAIKYLAIVQQAQAVMSSVEGGHAHGGVYEMVKALEEIGATQSPERFQKLLGGMVQASTAFGGKIGSMDFLQTLKYTRGAGRFYDDDFITKYLPTLIQELKARGGTGQGGGPGAPLSSLFQAVVANKFSRSTRDLGIQMGLIDPNLATLDHHGRMHNAPGAWRGADLAARNPYLWVQQVLIPAMRSQLGGHMLDQDASGAYVHVEQVAGELATLFGNRTAQQMVNLLMMANKMNGDRALIDSALPLGDAYNQLAGRMRNPNRRRDLDEGDSAYSQSDIGSPAFAQTALAAQWSRVLTDLGKALTPAVTNMTMSLANALSYLANVIERHPVITKVLLGVFAGIAVALTVMGTMAIGVAAVAAIASAPIMLAVTSLLALGAALAWLVEGAPGWSQISDFFRRFGEVLWRGAEQIWKGLTTELSRGWRIVSNFASQLKDAVVTDIGDLWARIGKSLSSLVSDLGKALDSLTAKIRDWISGIPAAIGNALRGIGGAGGGAPIPPGENPFLFSPGAYHPKGGYNGPRTNNSTQAANVNVYLDGQLVYQNQQRYRARDMQRPPDDSSTADGRLGILYQNQVA